MSGTSAPMLASVQNIFWRAITFPSGVRDFLEQASAADAELLESLFQAGGELDVVARMEIYAQAYFYRLKDALAESFPIVAWQLGEVEFHNLATDFLLAHPSASPNLHHLGRNLPSFLRAHSVGSKRLWLAAVAEMERQLSVAVDAPNGLPLTLDMLQELSSREWSELRLGLVPHASLSRVPVDFGALAQACREGRSPGTPSQKPGVWLVWRKSFKPHFRVLEPPEAPALELLQRGAAFSALAVLLEEAGEEPHQLAQLLRGWVDQGLLIRL